MTAQTPTKWSRRHHTTDAGLRSTVHASQKLQGRAHMPVLGVHNRGVKIRYSHILKTLDLTAQLIFITDNGDIRRPGCPSRSSMAR